jgi:CBS domain containing-hemolysin-like protein
MHAKLPVVFSTFIRRREHLFIVVDEYGGGAGVITLEDVIETILGLEIVDETDETPDMQELARRLIDARRRGRPRPDAETREPHAG